MQPSEKKSHADHIESAYKEFADGVDRALAPLRVVARLASLPQGAENCVDLWEVVDTVSHYVDVLENLRDKLDLNIEIGGNPGGKLASPGKKAGGKKGTAEGGGSAHPPADGRN